MTRATVATSAPALPQLSTTALTPAYQAYEILHVWFVVLPIAAGLDKFIHFLGIGSWEMYLCPLATRVTGLEATTFMHIVGVIEVIAGILVAFWPRVGGYIVMLWLWGIIVNLFLIPGFFDVALRDFGLSLGAIALARLSEEYGRPIH
ncbi:MAG TPA: hypothetical protein VGI40_15855 [Pirellulaceae bacterium]|jgi:hypothetical protein